MDSLFELNFRSHVPIYLQIVVRVKALIATEVLSPGDQLPTVRQLATELRVNFNTIARAYRLLDEAGIVSTQQGRGTFVREPLPPEPADDSRQKALQGITSSYLHEAAQMGFEPEEIEATIASALHRWREQGAPQRKTSEPRCPHEDRLNEQYGQIEGIERRT